MQFIDILDNLHEEYADQIKKKFRGEDRTMTIYKNPSNSEMRKLKKEGAEGFRIIIDVKKKNIYLFDKEILHSEASKELFKVELHGSEENYRLGFADDTGKIVHVRSFFDRVPRERKLNNIIRKWVSEKSKLTWMKGI